MKSRNIFSSLIGLLLFLAASNKALAGNEGRGGIPEAIAVDAFTRYITGEGLKLSMLNYLKTLDVTRITDPVDKDVAANFKKMMARGLAKDIHLSAYISGLENCRKDLGKSSNNPELFNPKVRAWTKTGNGGVDNIGGQICFDVEGLVADYTAQGLSIENAAIQLTALTYHEHTHHFQNESNDMPTIQQQEREANGVGGYVLRTAKLSQAPLIEWDSAAAKLNVKVGRSGLIKAFNDSKGRIPKLNYVDGSCNKQNYCFKLPPKSKVADFLPGDGAPNSYEIDLKDGANLGDTYKGSFLAYETSEDGGPLLPQQPMREFLEEGPILGAADRVSSTTGLVYQSWSTDIEFRQYDANTIVFATYPNAEPDDHVGPLVCTFGGKPTNGLCSVGYFWAKP